MDLQLSTGHTTCHSSHSWHVRIFPPLSSEAPMRPPAPATPTHVPPSILHVVLNTIHFKMLRKRDRVLTSLVKAVKSKSGDELLPPGLSGAIE